MQEFSASCALQKVKLLFVGAPDGLDCQISCQMVDSQILVGLYEFGYFFSPILYIFASKRVKPPLTPTVYLGNRLELKHE